MLEIYIDRWFWKYGYYSVQIISAVAKEFLLSCNLAQKASLIM